MSRFEELKEKGWKNLTSEERAEYKELKATEAPEEDSVEEEDTASEKQDVEETDVAVEPTVAPEETKEEAPVAQEGDYYVVGNVICNGEEIAAGTIIAPKGGLFKTLLADGLLKQK